MRAFSHFDLRLALVDKANALIAAAVASGQSEESIQLLHDYYANKASQAYDRLLYWHSSPEERRAAADGRAQEDSEKMVGK